MTWRNEEFLDFRFLWKHWVVVNYVTDASEVSIGLSVEHGWRCLCRFVSFYSCVFLLSAGWYPQWCGYRTAQMLLLPIGFYPYFNLASRNLFSGLEFILKGLIQSHLGENSIDWNNLSSAICQRFNIMKERSRTVEVSSPSNVTGETFSHLFKCSAVTF